MVVKRDLHVRPGARRVEFKFAHGAAGHIDLDAPRSRLAAQRTFMPALDPDLADLEVRQTQQGFSRVFFFLQIVGTYRADIADLMGEIGSERIDPRQHRFRVDARKRRRVHGNQ